MTTIQFYHLLSTPLEAALPKLMEKAQAAGLRGVIVHDTESTLARLDDALWQSDPASFIAHGLANEGAPEAQPLLLSLKEEPNNHAQMLVITDGRLPEDIEKYERILDIFNGRDAEATYAARKRWTHYKENGHMLQYIQQQENGGWKRAA